MTPYLLLLENFLKKLYPISESDFKKLSDVLFTKEFKAKERLLNIHDQEEHLYFIVKGAMRKYFLREKHEVITNFFIENNLANELVSFFTGSPSLYRIEAIEPTICLGITKNNLESLIKEIPLFEKICCLLMSKTYIKNEQKEYNKARQTKQERFLNFCNVETELLQRIPQKYLASYLEIAPETFCRLKHVRYDVAKKNTILNINA